MQINYIAALVENQYLCDLYARGGMTLSTLLKYALTTNDLAFEPEWLIEGLFAKESILFLFGDAGCGKSMVTMTMGLYLLSNGKIDRLIYLDGDNSRTALKMRKIDTLIKQISSEKLLYIPSFKIDNELIKVLETEILESTNKCHSLIILDSIRNFMLGKDVNYDKDAVEFMSLIQRLRNAGNSIIIMHHVNKQGQQKNSTSFNDFCDTSYKVSSTKAINDDLEVTFTNKKDRLGSNSSITATISFVEYRLKIVKGGVEDADKDIVGSIMKRLQQGSANTTELFNFITEDYKGCNRNKVLAVIKKYIGCFWIYEKGTNNSTIYSLISDCNSDMIDWTYDNHYCIKPIHNNTNTTQQTQVIRGTCIPVKPINLITTMKLNPAIAVQNQK